MYALAIRRWLAAHLGCEPTREAVTAAQGGGDPGGRRRVHEGVDGRRGRRRGPVGRGLPAAADPRGRVRRDDRRHRAPRRPGSSRGSCARDGTFDELVSGVEDEAERGGRRPELRGVQVDRRLPDRARHRRPDLVGRRGGVRSMAGRRLGRDEGAREAGPRLPDPPGARGREGERPAVPLPLRRRGPGHQPRARGPGVDVPLARRRAGSADRPRALGVPVGPGSRLRRLGPPERVPGALRADPVGMGPGGVGPRDARGDRPGGEAPLRIGRGRGAGGVLGVGPARAIRARSACSTGSSIGTTSPRTRRSAWADSCSATRVGASTASGR